MLTIRLRLAIGFPLSFELPRGAERKATGVGYSSSGSGLDIMDSTLITAMAGVFGSLVGASASIGTTWLAKRTEIMRITAERNLRERETLYKEFLTEASRVAVHALTHSFEGPDQIVSLYGILSRIRLVASSSVVHEGELCCLQILATYGKPNITVDELRRVLTTASDLGDLDPLKAFSNACREELRAIEARLSHRS